MSTSRQPLLVLLPGLDGTEVFFRPLLDRLPAQIATRSIVFDDRGPYTYAALLTRLRAQLADAGSAFVLGSSFSGPLAVLLAEAEPDKVRGLILVATFLRSPKRVPPWARFAVTGPMVWALRVARRLPVWARRVDDPVRVAKRETWSRVSARSLAARARAVLRADVRENLRRCRGLPVLSVAYDADTVVPERCADEIAAHGAQVRSIVLPGSHFGLFDDPRRLADEIVRFMGDAGGPTSAP